MALSARPRVVVTGLGLVSCLGVGTRLVWQRLLDGQTGIARLESPELRWLPCRVGGLVPFGDKPGQLNSSLLKSTMARQRGMACVYTLLAAEQALMDSRWLPEDDENRRLTGSSVGKAASDVDFLTEVSNTMYKAQSLKRVSPFAAARAATTMSSFTVCERFGFRGPQYTLSTACAAGSHAIISAYQSLVLGDAKVMVCGGCEHADWNIMLGIYAKTKALSTRYNDEPDSASRPFDQDRDGFVLGEGAGMLVLETLDNALSRGAPIYAEILGYGLCTDSGTVTSPHEDGLGMVQCMNMAIKNAGLKPSDVGCVNAHATSTPVGDAAEAKAIIQTFGPNSVFVASNKGAVGHMQGAAGAVEAISSVLSCHEGSIPPTVNLAEPDVEGLNHVMGGSVEWPAERRIVVSNSAGFGSICTSLVFSNYRK